MRVLVVDDEPDVRALMVLVLNDAGYETDELGSGAGVIEKALAFSPDVIVLDVTMPGLDGFAALELLRNDSSTATIPVLMASAQGQRGTIVKARDLGATDFMVKPWDDGELEWRVGECLERGQDEQIA